MRPLVSVLVPSYGHAEYLDACLSSAVSQTYQDWEMVVVDDQSPDDSFDIAALWAQKDPRISVRQNAKNLGTYGTLQAALDAAKGAWVAVLNSDDLWEPHKLEVQVEALAAHREARACTTLGWMVDSTGALLTRDDPHGDWPTSLTPDLVPFLAYENRILASSVLFAREGLRFRTECRYSGDWLALIDAATSGQVVCVPQRLTHWRQHGSNTYTTSARQVGEEIRVREALHRNFGDASDPALRRGLGMNALNLCALYSLAGMAGRSAPLLPAMVASGLPGTALKRWVGSIVAPGVLRERLWAGVTRHVAADDARQAWAQAPELAVSLRRRSL